jgi:N utilization substance protein B
MLNRRILRVKAMQALYSYQVSQQSLQKVTKDQLVDRYALDPAVHDFTEKPIFEARQRLIGELFEKYLKTKKVTESPEDLDQDILDDINSTIDSYFTTLDSERRRIKEQMISQAEKIYDWYIKLLLLPGELAFIEKQEKEKLEKSHINKSIPSHFPLEESGFIQKLNTTPELVNQAIDAKIGWQGEEEFLRQCYKELVKQDETYQALQNNDKSSNEDIQEYILHFYKQGFFKHELTLEYMTERLLSWEEDAPVLRNMLVKTIKSFEAGVVESFELRPLSINKEDDFSYFEELFSETIRKNDELGAIIQSKTKNWDLSRISSMDIIILRMALTEMMIFPSIPVKVTINEFIEISKHYSTPKSKQFINGILDVLANELTSKGVIKKSGRGLIDNK